MPQTAVELTQSFLGAIFSGAMEAAMALTSPEAVFISTNPNSNPSNPMHGTFVGHEGAQAFFEVTAAFGDETHAALYGTLNHTVRATGKPFISDWALITRFEDGELVLYHFYEDTEALSDAMR